MLLRLKSIGVRLIVSFIALTTLSCAPNIEKKVKIVEVANVDMRGLSGVDIGIVVENDTRYTFTLEAANATLVENNNKLVTMQLFSPVVINKKSVDVVSTRWKFKDVNAMVMLSLGNRFLQGDDADNMFVNMSATVSCGPIKREISRNNIPISEILANFDKAE